MNLPNYIIIICDINGNIIQSPDNIEISKIMDIIHEDSLLQFHEYVKSMFSSENYIQTHKLKLKNNKNYYLTIEIINGKICCTFQECDDIDHKNIEDFWMNSIFKYNYHINKYIKILNSLSNLVENIFYKNRSDIKNIIIELCTVLKLQYSLVMFHNGKDHAIYCKDNISDFECIDLDKDNKIDIDDNKFNENVYKKIANILIVKRYEDTYFGKLLPNIKDNTNKKVYILKLMFGDTVIGYFEFIPHSFVELEKIEINLLQNLSTILAYVIYNKSEELIIKKYITEKLCITKS